MPDPTPPTPSPTRLSRPLGERLRREASVLGRLAAPLVGGQVAQVGLSFIDTVMAGRLSPVALAAVAVGASVWGSIFLFILGVLLALPAFVAEMDGAGRRDRVGPFARQGFWLALALAAFAVAALYSVRPLLVALDVRPELVPTVLGYLRALSWGVPFLGVYLAARFTSEGLGLTRPMLYFGLLGLPLNVLGNWLLMYGHLGLPRLGAVGCGHATACVWTAQCAGMLIYLKRRSLYRGLRLFERLEAPDPRQIGRILRVGVPSGLSIFIEASLFSAVALLLGSLGTVVVAGHQVALNFAALAFMVPLGISMAISVRVGNALGRRDRAAARFSALVGAGMAMVFQATTAVVMTTLPRAVARIYTSDPRVIEVAAALLLLAALFQFSDGVQVTAAGALRGLQDTRVPMGMVLVAYWGVGMPLGYTLAFRAGLGARGMWMGLIAGLTAAALLLAWRFLRVTRPGAALTAA